MKAITHPKQKGEVAEAIVAAVLLSNGLVLSKPIGDNCSYDLIIDNGKSLSKCQVKTGRLRNGSVTFNTTRSRINTTGSYKKPYSNDDVHVFAVYCFETAKVYLVPNFGLTSSCCLRVDEPKNNQEKNTRFAINYSVGAFLSK